MSEWWRKGYQLMETNASKVELTGLRSEAMSVISCVEVSWKHSESQGIVSRERGSDTSADVV